MKRALHVAEKNSVAKAISAVLGKGRVIPRQGCSSRNLIYELQYPLFGENYLNAITAVAGHLKNYEFVEQYSIWTSCEPVELFSAPIKKSVTSGNQDIEKSLQREARKASSLVLWLDCDREGENIAYEVIEVCCEANRRLNVYRAHFSSLVPSEIIKAWNNLALPNPNISASVDARIELDLRIGSAFTRFQTLRFQRLFFDLAKRIISYGPCQFPTLGFVVGRYWQIQSHVEEQFWSVRVEVSGEEDPSQPSTAKPHDNIATFSWARVRLFDHDICTLFLEKCVNAQVATITKVEAKPKRKYKPLPLTTVELQKNGARLLHLSSDEVMKIAEGLYSKGMISYPRTETDTFPDGFDFQTLIHDIGNQNQPWSVFAQHILNGGFRPPRMGSHNDKAHPPIHPTRALAKGELNGSAEKVYEFVTRRFLACCSEDALGQQTTVELELGNEIFRCSGEMVIEQNYLKVYLYDRWSSHTIPTFTVGTRVTPKLIDLTCGKTTPPPLLKEEDLISLMDKNGIGTDATIADHIKKIQEREYVTVTPQGYFVPTTLGLALVEGYESLGFDLSLPHRRAETEAQMAMIVNGQLDKEKMVSDSLAVYKEIFVQVNKCATQLDARIAKHFQRTTNFMKMKKKDFMECGKCHHMLDLKENEKVSSLVCSNCSLTLTLPYFNRIEALTVLCPYCGFHPVEIETKSTHNLCPYCFNFRPEENEKMLRCFKCVHPDCPLSSITHYTPIARCPMCQSGSILPKKGKTGICFGCSSYPKCRAYLWLPAFIKDLRVTKELCQNCLSKGNELQLVRFVTTVDNQRVIIPGVAPTFVGCIGFECDEKTASIINHDSAQDKLAKFWKSSNNNSNSIPNPQTNAFRSQTNPSNRPFNSIQQFQSYPNNFQNQPNNYQNQSNNYQNQPNNHQNQPNNNQNLPNNYSNQSNNHQNQSNNFQNQPNNYQTQSNNYQNLPNNYQNQPNNNKNLPNNYQNQSNSFLNYQNQQSYSATYVHSTPLNNNNTFNRTNFTQSKAVPSTVTCFRCQKPGHYASACPESTYSGSNTQPNSKSKAKTSFNTMSINTNKKKNDEHSVSANKRKNGEHSASATKRKNDENDNSSTGTKKARTCSVCHTAGHTARTCPHK